MKITLYIEGYFLEINRIIEELKDDLIDSTAELIKIKSIEGEAKEGKPYGEGVAVHWKKH